MRFIQRALIVMAAFAAAGAVWAQEPSTPPDVAPAPVVSTPAEPPATTEAAPVAPNPEVAPVPVPDMAPIPQSAAPAPVPESVTTAPAQQASPKIAPAVPNKATRTHKTREIKPVEPVQDQQDQKAAAAAAAGTAAAAPGDAGQVPPSAPGPDAAAAVSEVPPAPVAEQRPVVAPTAVETSPATSHGSLWLLIGGLVLGAGGIVSMLRRRGRDESISIVDHGATTTTRPPIVAHQSSRV